MTTDFTVDHECIILDACCVINLYASRYMASILQSVSRTIAIATYIYDEEALWIYGGPDDSRAQMKEAIDLQPLIEQGLLILVSTDSEAEEISYIDFARYLDDGEAITSAIALHRNWAIATDDRKAKALLTQLAPHLQIISTLELIKYWADTIELSEETLCTVLKNVKLRANYEPHSSHSLYAWWKRFRD